MKQNRVNKLSLLLGIIIISFLFYRVFSMEALTQALNMYEKLSIFSTEVCYYMKELNLAKEYRDLCLESIMKNRENITQVLEDKNTTDEIKDFAKMIVDKQLYEIANFIEDIKQKEDFYKPYENIFVYSCYLLSWLYVLFFIF